MLVDYIGECLRHPVIENSEIIRSSLQKFLQSIKIKELMKDRSKNESGKKFVSMPVINEHAAGIDVGSRSHFVAVGQGKDDVREFGVYHNDLHDCVAWLSSCGIETVSMESTGSYWQNLYDVLVESGFEVLLVSGAHTKNMKGRKTDVQDCQWIQYLHSVGFLTGSFLPDFDTEELRTLCRHRDFLRRQGSKYICKMQKSLRLMNFRLDIVLSDITGESGQAIIKAIISGETDPVVLAGLANYRVKKPREEIARALSYNGRRDYMYELADSFDIYQSYTQKIASCDREIEGLMRNQINKLNKPQSSPPPLKKTKKLNKNSPKIPLEKLSWQWNDEVNLMSIKGVSHSTMLTVNSEVGLSIGKFPTPKHFTSWLRLSPNTRKTGGKVISSHVPKGSNRLAASLRHAAESIGKQKDAPLYPFFQRIAHRKGRCAAIIATARKLAVIIWNMLTKKEVYMPYDTTLIESQIRDRQIKKINKLMQIFDVKITELKIAYI
jgi:transposase